MKTVTVSPEREDGDRYIIVKIYNKEVKELKDDLGIIQQHLSTQLNDDKRMELINKIRQDLTEFWKILNPS